MTVMTVDARKMNLVVSPCPHTMSDTGAREDGTDIGIFCIAQAGVMTEEMH